MEETETEEKFLEDIRFLAFFEFAVIDVLVGTKQVCAQTLRWFDGHLDTILEDGDRELGRWHGCKPKSEILMHVLVEFFANPLELSHPADCKMAIL
jgi:hypothetical protein